ncbi:MAG: hypothetical protein ACT4P1_17365, partial [Sporichthyaceae bacterium]
MQTAPALTDRRCAPLRRLAAVTWGHAAGDVMVAVALANTLFFAVPLDDARGRIVLYLALSMAPVAMLTPVLDRVLVRYATHLRATLVLTTALRSALAVGLLLQSGIGLLYPMALALMVVSRVHGIARVAVIPEVAPPGRDLVWVNTVISATAGVGAATGAALGAGAVALGGSNGGLAAAAATYGFVALIAAVTPLRSDAAGAVHVEPSPAAGGIFGPRAVDHLDPRVVAAGVAMAVIRFATGFLTFLLAFATREHPSLLTAVVAAAVLGGALGTFGACLAREIVPAWLLPPLLCLALGLVAGAATPDVTSAWAVVVAGAAGFAWAAGKVAFDSEVQEVACLRTRRGLLTRYSAGFQICWVLGAAASLPPVEHGYALAGLAVGCLVGAVGALVQALQAPVTVRVPVPSTPAAA